jgi:uncharacterized protein YbjT (DUF2867 family)
VAALLRRGHLALAQVDRPVEAYGAICLPWGKDTTILPLVSAEDVARNATGLLTSPSLTAATAYAVIGAAISLQEIIATFGRALNKGRELRRDHRRVVAQRTPLARWNAHAVYPISV